MERRRAYGGPRFVCDQVRAGGCWRAPQRSWAFLFMIWTKVHRDGEQEDQKEKVDVKE